MLHALSPAPGSTRPRKRVGRGIAAGGGKTAGRGTKGQGARTGKGHRFGFEGGQIPLLRRQPKLGGFRNPNRQSYEIVNLRDLEAKLDPGSYNLAALRERGILRTAKPVKLLGDGCLTKKLSLEVHAASRSARSAVEKAGGSVTIVP
jgi:large subunit ribosomal protein L15